MKVPTVVLSCARGCAQAALVVTGVLIATAPNIQAQNAAAAAKTTVDPSGTWRWEHDEEGETVKDVLNLNYDKKANKVTGTYKGRRGPLKVEDGKMDGDKLTFKMNVELDNNDVDITVEGRIDGDKVAGTIKFEADGQSGDMPWEAKRSLKAEDVVGTWTLKIETPNGNTMTPTIKISREGEQLKGNYDGFNGQFQADAKDMAIKDGKLHFAITMERDGNAISTKYMLVPRGDSLTGKIAYDLNGNSGELDITGTRKAEQ